METKTNRDMKDTRREVEINNKGIKKEVFKKINNKSKIRIRLLIISIIIILLITSLSIFLISIRVGKTKSNENIIKNGTEIIENKITIDKSKLINNNNEVFQKDTKINTKDELINCEIGFFIPTDIVGEKICQKCQIDKCAKCSGTKLNNKCTLCQTDFKPIIKNNVITFCSDCETGSGEKCLKCDFTKNQCSDCNPGYFLPGDDKIKKNAKNVQ